MVAIRLVVVAVVLTFLAMVIAQHEHGGVKGMPVPLLNVISSMICAAVAAAVCRLKFDRLSGWLATPFVGGIAGSFGILNGFYGPFGGIVGFLVGAVVLVLPMPAGHEGSWSQSEPPTGT